MRHLKKITNFLQRKRHTTILMLFGIFGVITYACIQTGMLVLFILGLIVILVTELYVEMQF